MEKNLTLFLVFFALLSIRSQEKEVVKDSVKTEIVNVVTKYNPKIADAKKIRLNPKLTLLKKNEKKKLKYTIFSAPVASTFTPKSGVVKGIDVGVKERIYKNYIAAGYGNYASSFFETFLHHSTRFENEFGFNTKYLASQDNVRNSVLNSNFSNFKANAFFKKNDRYFDWKLEVNSERNTYNWYGLPNIIFTEPTINAINEEQIYNFFEVAGTTYFKDSYIDFGKINLSYFTDKFKSSEILANFEAKLDFPLKFIHPKLNDITIRTNVEFLKGNFKENYRDATSVDYSTVTININPQYKISYKGFIFRAGLKLIASLDSENNSSNKFIIPEILIQRPILKQYVNVYAGFTGDLHTNTYRSFTEKNPYISPTQFITQTLEASNFFGGFNGKITRNLSYNINVSSKSEEDKPLFLRNASKSDGTNNLVNGNPLKGYEYGNSFSIYYDDIKTLSFFTEIEYDFSKELSFGLQAMYNRYTTTNALSTWNLPEIEASLTAKYKTNKWYATLNAFYVSERFDALYNGQFPSSLKGVETINSFIDVNLNGGYHFNDKFSAFLKLNNVLNTQYQRFANFDTQGFQVLGGITYKFDF